VPSFDAAKADREQTERRDGQRFLLAFDDEESLLEPQPAAAATLVTRR